MQQVTDSSIELADRQLSARSADLHAPHEAAQSALSRRGSTQGQVSRVHDWFCSTTSNVKAQDLAWTWIVRLLLPCSLLWSSEEAVPMPDLTACSADMA